MDRTLTRTTHRQAALQPCSQPKRRSWELQELEFRLNQRRQRLPRLVALHPHHHLPVEWVVPLPPHHLQVSVVLHHPQALVWHAQARC